MSAPQRFSQGKYFLQELELFIVATKNMYAELVDTLQTVLQSRFFTFRFYLHQNNTTKQ